MNIHHARHHPPRRSRCLLRLGRAAARSVAARQADRGRRRRRAGGVVRGQGVRREGRHAGTAGARALPAAHLRRRSLQGVLAAGRCRDEGARRLHAAGRAHLDRRGLRRRRGLHASLRLAGRDRPEDPAAREERARAADLGRRSAHQASRQDRLAGRQARRPGRGRSRPRARLPARPAGRVDVGRGPGHAHAAGRARRDNHRPAGAIPRRMRSIACSVRRRARSSWRWPGTATRARSARTIAHNPPARSRRSAASPPSRASTAPRWPISPTASARGCAPSRWPAAP